MVNKRDALRLYKECLLTNATTNQEEIAQDVNIEKICRLWAGMGYVYRISSSISTHPSVIVKHVTPQYDKAQIGDCRKAESYQVEACFYENIALRLIQEYQLRIPYPYLVERGLHEQVTICMCELTGESEYITEDHTKAVLEWLATFHAATWGQDKVNGAVELGLQSLGTYWHLNTRPEEHESMLSTGWEGRLKLAARAIDIRLKRDRFQCCVHGDAKEANIVFTTNEKGEKEAWMYDFQYCGKGPPTKDLAYFLSVAAHNNGQDMVECYYNELLNRLEPNDDKPTLAELQESLDLACCDWVRFQCGWGFWGVDMKETVLKVLDRLDGGTLLKSEDAYLEAIKREYP